MKPINDAYEMYSKLVIPKNAGPVQKSETRQAFFAGAYTVYQMMMAMENWPEKAAENFITIFNKEMKEYMAEINYNALMEKVARGGE